MPEQEDQVIYLQKIYANVYNEITQPDKVFVATQYFRKKWVPLLGHALAWLIIALRQHCYWNKRTGEMRDWCRVTQEELAQEIGAKPRTVRRLLQREFADKFVVEIKKRYRYDLKLQKQVRQKSFYRVRMDDPLVPEDEELLRQRIADEIAGLEVDPDTGQRDMLRLLDRLTNSDADDLAEKTESSSKDASDLKDNLSGRTGTEGDLPDKLSGKPPDLEDNLSGRTGVEDDLPDKLSAISYTGQNVRNNNSTYIVHAGPPTQVQQQQQYTPTVPVVAVVHLDELKELVLANDQVLIPATTDDEQVENTRESFSVCSLAEIAKQDLRAAGQYNGLLSDPGQLEVYYSIEHARGEGGDEWTEEETQKIRMRNRLERELGEFFERLGDFSLEGALQQYFSPDLALKFLADKSEAELTRIEDWVAYTRTAKGLTNPGGFLRSKIESREHPPPTA